MSESKRLHISGLNPTQCSLQDLHSRFRSFQLQVRDVHNWPPGKDGVGNIQDWCFLTVEGEASKIRRATDLLNGTTWKGSKLRIGAAKKEVSTEKQIEKVNVEEVDLEKKKKKKKSRGVESEKIKQTITIEDVEEGVWGWKKTPAGHLLRPLHMRPSHPLPRPTAKPIVASDGIDDKDKKRKRKGVVNKPMTRARRVTIDPSRYGAIHLSGLVLDDGTEAMPNGMQWECEETDEGDILWMLKDVQGNTIKTEKVRLAREEVQKEVYSESDRDSESEEESSLDEVAAAINNALSDSSSESGSDDEVREERENEDLMHSQKTSAEPFRYPSFDPGEESDFSEGYQEMQAETRPQPRDWTEEKTGHLNLLKTMFGEKALASESQPPLATKAPVEDESEDEEMEEAVAAKLTTEDVVEPPAETQTKAQKRAALLKTADPSSESKSFKAIVRFDPGTSAQENEGSVQESEEQGGSPTGDVNTTNEAAEAHVPVDEVQMSSLKDMFRPKEASAGFSLMGDLDLDLEEEEVEEEDAAEEVHTSPAVPNRWVPEPAQLVPPPSSTEKLPFFFPFPDNDGRSWFSILQNDPTIAKFCKDKTDEELQAQWKERKGQLTQDYKRRHREALKKKKRKYTGSRAAGTSLPSRS